MRINDNPDIKFNWRHIVSEFIATLFYVFIGTCSIVTSIIFLLKVSKLEVAIAHGFGLVTLIHIFGGTSGAHLNPAVTLGAMVTRHIGILEGVLYIAAQLLGGIAGSAITLLVYPNAIKDAKLGAFQFSNIQMGRGFVLELVLSFLLVLTYFGSLIKSQHLAEDTGLQQITSLFAKIPIGFVQTASMLVGAATGPALNPARQFGPELLSWNWNANSWVYYVAPILGGILGAVVYEFILTKPRRDYIRLK